MAPLIPTSQPGSSVRSGAIGFFPPPAQPRLLLPVLLGCRSSQSISFSLQLANEEENNFLPHSLFLNGLPAWRIHVGLCLCAGGCSTVPFLISISVSALECNANWDQMRRTVVPHLKHTLCTSKSRIEMQIEIKFHIQH